MLLAFVFINISHELSVYMLVSREVGGFCTCGISINLKELLWTSLSMIWVVSSNLTTVTFCTLLPGSYIKSLKQRLHDKHKGGRGKFHFLFYLKALCIEVSLLFFLFYSKILINRCSSSVLTMSTNPLFIPKPYLYHWIVVISIMLLFLLSRGRWLAIGSIAARQRRKWQLSKTFCFCSLFMSRKVLQQWLFWLLGKERSHLCQVSYMQNGS